MSQLVNNLQEKLKNSSNSLFLLSFRLATGLLLGLTITLIGQEVFAYESFLFVFVMVVIAGLFMRKSRNWQWTALFVFNLVCVLIAMLLRMYILVAPGA